MALTTAQQALLLFKKWLGLGQTTASREFFNETGFPGRVAVYTNQIWTQADQIPTTAPALTNGQTSGVVQYWQDVTLGAVAGTTNAFTSSLLIDTIPFNYGDGTSYNYTIKDSTNASIAFGQGDWILDTDAGLLTFYSTVPANMPPKVSFYKYVGAKGFTSSSVVVTASLFGTSSWANNATSASYVEYTNLANKPTLVSASSQIQLDAITGATFSNASFLFPQNLRVEGTLTAQELRTELVTSSIIFESGSTKFGDSVDDTHQFTGSLSVFGTISGSIVLPTGIISSSTQVVSSLPTGAVSSSQQINTGSFSGSFVGSFTGTSSFATSASFAVTASYVSGAASTWDSISNKPSGLVSSSQQINTGSFTGSFIGDGSQLTGVIASGVVVTVVDDGIVQGNAGRLDFGNLITATVSSNTASISVTLPTGTVSSSLQINTGSFSGSFTGNFIGTSSVSTTSSFATNADLLDGLNSSVFATTGSNVFVGNQRITGSVILSSSAAVELQVIGDTEFTGSLAITQRIVATSITASLSGSLAGTASFASTASRAITASFVLPSGLPTGVVSSSGQINTGSFSGSFTGILLGTGSWATSASIANTASYTPPTFIDNLVTVGLAGSNTNYTSIKTAVDSITDASVANTYTVRVYPGVYIEDTITLKPYIAVKGDSSTSTIVSASNPSASIFVMADQTMVIDMQIQGSTAPNVSAVVYSSPTTPQTNAIAYLENVRFGTNYTNAKVIGSGSSGNCILQCSNVKYGGFTQDSKSFDVGFHVTSGSSGGIGRMQLRNVTSTNGGVAGSSQDQVFALADAPGCTFIVNGCLLTRAVGSATGTGFKVYNGGQLRLTGVNFQRWTRGIWAPQTGSAPSIDAIALNFENCTTDVAIEHTGSLGKVQGTDNFLKTQIALNAPLYEVGQDPRKITVAKKGGDFTSISASVAYITDSAEDNRYIIEVGPGQFTEKEIDLTNKPYISIFGSDIQATEIIASGSNHNIFKLGNTSEVSFMTLRGAGAGYAAFDATDLDGFALVHKISIYDCDYGVKIRGNSAATSFFGEYVDINGTFSYGTYISSSNGTVVDGNMENYYLFPSASAVIGNYVAGPSASLSLYAAKFQGDGTANSTAIRMENGSVLEAAALDIQSPEYGLVIPAGGNGPEFRIVGGMIHDTGTYDFDVQNANTRGRFQGVSDHSKINNNSENFYWNFLDDTDGENDVTRKLSVTFADGTHTDATTLIFKGSSMGVLDGGRIVTSSGLTVTTLAGYGYLHDPINPEVFKRFDWANGNITLTANSSNYLFINSTGTLTADATLPNFAQNIILGRVVTNATGVEFIDQSSWNAEHTANRLSKFTRQALGPVFAEGSIVTEDATPFKLDVTAGNYYFAENNFLPVGTSSINLAQYYPSASTWARYTSSIVPNNVYASSSALTPMSSSAYTKHTVYLIGDGIDEKYFLVINSNQYDTLVQAENAALPSIPSYFDDGVVPIAAVYVRSGSANITQIQDIRPIIGFRAAGVNASSVHGNLLGLSADDHPQYLLVNGTRAMAGNLSLGGNDITNVGTMFGTASWANNAVTASAATSITFIPTTASFATTSSFSTSGSFAVSSSRSVTSSFAISSSMTVTSSFALSASFAVSSSRSITSSFAISSSFAPTILPSGIVSSSTQVNYTQLQNIPSGIVSSSAQVVALLPNGTVSSSSQINTGSFSGSFTGNFVGTSSWASNATTASFATTASAATSITFTPATASFAQTASFVNILNQTISASGNVEAGINLISKYSVADEGGEIQLARPQTNTSISGSVVIDINQNRVRIFESNSPNRGGYWDITTLGAGVGTNLAGGAGTVTSITAGDGLTGGTITGAGTITVDTGSAHFITGSISAVNLKGVISSSTQVDYSQLQNIPSGLVSSSAQINTGSFTGSFTGEFIGTSSWASNATSASFATSASWAPGGTTFPYIGNADITGSLRVSGSLRIISGGITGSGAGILLENASTNLSILPNANYRATNALHTFVVNGTTGLQIDSTATSPFSTNVHSLGLTGNRFLNGYINNIFSSGSITNTGSINILSGSINVTNGGITGSLLGTSSLALTAQTASYFDGFITFPSGLDITGSLVVTGSQTVIGNQTITGSLILSSSAPVELLVIGDTEITGSLRLATGGITGSLLGTSSWASNAVSSSFATSASYAPTILPSGVISSSTQVNYTELQNIPSGLVSSSVQINTGSFSGSFVGEFIGTSSWASNAVTASAATSITFTPTTASYAESSSVAISSSFATSASWAPSVGGNSFGTISVSGQNDVVADQSNDTLTLVAGTNVSITTNDTTDTITINATAGDTFPYTGNAIITGSLLVSGSGTTLQVSGAASVRDNLTVNGGTLVVDAPSNRTSISGSLAVTGSTTILGSFAATTKSFKIDHQKITGKSLIYGVLEGPEHAVYARGRVSIGLTGTQTIYLPEEWEWLVDADSITVQLTSIGTSHIAHVKDIGNNRVIIQSDISMDCFYLIHATRKDVPNLITVE